MELYVYVFFTSMLIFLINHSEKNNSLITSVMIMNKCHPRLSSSPQLSVMVLIWSNMVAFGTKLYFD